MSINIGTLDIGVAFAGDTSGLQKATGEAQAGIDKFGASTSKSMRQVREDAQGAELAVGRLATGLKGAVVGGSMAVGLVKLKNTVIEVSDALIQAQVQLDKLNNGFKFGAGGAAGGARELSFVREEANRLGLEIGGAATQYMKMVAAARGTNMEGSKTRELFTSIAEASTVMGMSGEQSERAMMAVVQMMSKGKVQAEELRGQLGEHLPGAFAIAARAMGVTEVELNKLMETGQVMSVDFLPKFAAQLRGELAGSVEDATKSMQASLNRYETAWLTFKQNVAQSGVSDALGGQINILSDAFNGISERMEAARKSGGGFFSQTAAGAAGVLAFANPLNAFSYQAISLAGQLDQAKEKLAALEKERPYSGNIFLGPAIAETKQLIAELERAKAARDQLSRQPGTGASESRYSAMAEDAALAAQRAKGQAYAALFEKMATPQEKFTAAVFEAKKNLGELYGPEVEARLRENFIKPTRKAKDEVDEFARALESVQEKDSGLNTNYTETLSALYGGFKKGRIAVDDYAAAVEALIKQQPFYKKGLDDEKKAQDEATKANIEAGKANNAAFDEYFERQEKARIAAEGRIKTGRETLEQLQFETSLLGMNAQQRAVATAMRELERQGIVKGTEAYEKYAEAIKNATSNLETQREDLDYWKSIESTAKSVWTDVADQGVSAFERIGKTIKASVLDALWQATGRKWLIQAGVSMGVPGASLAAQQAGIGGAVGTAANVYSLYGAAGQAGAFVGSLGSAATYGTAIGSQQGAMLAAQEMGMGTLAGNAASFGAALPWIGGAIALLSLISSMDDSGTMHTGGSAIADSIDGIRQVESATIGFGLAAADVSTQVVSSSKQLAGSMLGILQGLDKLSGGTGKYSVATGFADDSSQDGAWGSLAISKDGKTVVDWRDTQTSRWAPKEFADGEAGAKQYGDAVAASVKQAIDTIDLPDWAATMVKRLGDTPTMDQLTETIAAIVAMPEQMLQSIGTSSQQLADVIYLGMQASDPMGAGKAVADQITYGIEASLYNNFASQVTGIISTQLVTPVLTAMATGATLTEAMATASISTMKTQVAAAGAAFAAIVGDPGFKSAMADIGSTIAATVSTAMGTSAAPVAPEAYDPLAKLSKATETGVTKAADVLSGLLDEEKKLRIQEAQVFGDTAEEIRLLTQGMSDFEIELFLSNRSLAENIAAQQRVNNLKDEEKDLNVELLRARGDEAGALALLTEGMGEAEKSQYLYNQGIRDQITAIDKAAEAAAKLTQDLQNMATTADNTAATFLSGSALSDFQNSRIAEQLNAAIGSAFTGADLAAVGIGDIKSAVLSFVSSNAAPAAKTAVLQLGQALITLKENAATTARDLAFGNADAAFANLVRAISAQRKLAENSKTAAETLKTEVQGVFDTLESNVTDLFGQVDSARTWQAAQGQQFIAAALAAAKATGVLPDGKDLAKAITASRAGLDAAQYQTQAEADFSRLVLANELRDLQDISGDQLTEAERQLKAAESTLIALDDALQYASDQLSELKGINTGVVTLAQAMAAFQFNLTQAKPLTQTLTASGGTGGSYSMATGQGVLADGRVWDVATVTAAAFELQAAKGNEAVYDAIKNSGYTLAQAEKIFGSPAGSLEAEARKLGLPVFHEGTNYVPKTGYALLQEGEAVIPRAYNPGAGGNPGSTDNQAELLTELRLLRQQNERLEARLQAIEGHTGQFSDQFDRVSAGGNAVATEALA